MEFLNKFGGLNSVYPPTKYLTFGPWIYLVPQYKPKNVLILGYAGGTVAGLIRLLYGDILITGVDIETCENLYNIEFIKANAREFVKSCKQYDCVIVDLFLNTVDETMCDFVLNEEFVRDVNKIANYAIVNTLNNPDMTVWNRFIFVGMNQPAKITNKIYYYRTAEIPGLLP